MNRRMLGVLVLFSLSGCALLQDFLNAAFVKPTFRFVRAEPESFSLTGMTLNTVWEVENPNSVGLSLARADYALFIEGKQVVAGSPPHGLQIPAGGRAQLVFPASVKFADVAPVVTTFLTQDRAKYRVQGTVGLETPIGVIDFPMATEGDFEVPKLPEVRFETPPPPQVSFTGVSFVLPLTVTNRNSYQLPISGVTGTLTVAGAAVGTVTTGDLGLVPPRQTRKVNLPVTLNLLQGASAAISAIQSGKADVRFNAQVLSGGSQLPLDVNQLLQFAR